MLVGSRKDIALVYVRRGDCWFAWLFRFRVSLLSFLSSPSFAPFLYFFRLGPFGTFVSSIGSSRLYLHGSDLPAAKHRDSPRESEGR